MFAADGLISYQGLFGARRLFGGRGLFGALPDPLLSAVLTILDSAIPSGAILYDPSRGQSLWQDSTRAVPGAVNSVVGAMDDISGNGHHALQATTANKPFLRGTPQGAELLTGGDFASDAGWTAGAGWVIGSGVATATTASAALERADLSGVNGALYEVSYTITRSAGSVTPNIGGVAGTARSVAGRYSDWITATGTGTFRFTCSGFTGTVDNVTVKRAEAANVAAPYFLYADGTNDCMQAAAIDMSAVDKVFTCTGTQVDIPLGFRFVYETSAAADTTNGAIVQHVSHSGTGGWAWGARGSATQANVRIAAPTVAGTKNVVATQYDLSQAVQTNTIKPRVDAAVPTLVGGTATTPGNLGNHALNLFSRNQASLFFAGRFYGLILIARSTVLTAGEVAICEQWAYSKVGWVGNGFALGDSTISAYNGTQSVPSFIDSVHAKVVLADPADTIAQQKTAWQNASGKSDAAWVVIQVGLNDLVPGADTAPLAIARLQDLVDTVVADVPASCAVFVSKMIPCRARLIVLYGEVNGETSYQKWLSMNEAIAGGGAFPITGVDGRVTAHEPLMNDGSGNLAAAYDTGDGIHPNNAGREVNAQAWEDALNAAGITV